jgi:hypothetical protein
MDVLLIEIWNLLMKENNSNLVWGERSLLVVLVLLELFFLFSFFKLFCYCKFSFFLQTTHSSHHMYRTRQTYHKCKWQLLLFVCSAHNNCNKLPTIEVLKAKLKSREKMERSNSIFKDKSKDHEDRWLKLL